MREPKIEDKNKRQIKDNENRTKRRDEREGYEMRSKNSGEQDEEKDESKGEK